MNRSAYGPGRTFARALVILAGAGLLGCGGGDPGTAQDSAAVRTQAQRDSAVAASKLPGASAVGRAQETSDAAAARAAAMDSIEP